MTPLLPTAFRSPWHWVLWAGRAAGVKPQATTGLGPGWVRLGFGVPVSWLGVWAAALGLTFSLPSTPDPHPTAPQVVFRKPLQSLQAEEGTSASLWCELSEPSAAVVWSKGGLELQADERWEPQQRGHVAELVFRDLRREDTGEYTCTCGSQATSATLTVTGGPRGWPHVLWEIVRAAPPPWR